MQSHSSGEFSQRNAGTFFNRAGIDQPGMGKREMAEMTENYNWFEMLVNKIKFLVETYSNGGEGVGLVESGAKTPFCDGK